MACDRRSIRILIIDFSNALNVFNSIQRLLLILEGLLLVKSSKGPRDGHGNDDFFVNKNNFSNYNNRDLGCNTQFNPKS